MQPIALHTGFEVAAYAIGVRLFLWQRRRLELPVLTDRDRLSVGLRIFYVIPHVVCLIGLGIYAAILVLINFFIVLFTGEWNAGMRDTVIKVQRWYVRVSAYFLLLTDEYPPFTLD